MHIKKIVFVFILFIPVILFSQTNYNLPEVIVTATKTSTPGIEIASSYSVITNEELIRLQIPTAADALINIVGLNITRQGGHGKLTSVFTRGANTNHTLILIDGIEVNDPSSPNNAFDLSNLMIESIERIEIVRGPQSTLYGSESLAGVINVITKRGKGKPGLSILAEGGGNDYYKGVLNSAGTLLENINYSLNLSKLKTNGISAASSKYGNKESDGFENTFANASLRFNINDHFNTDLSYRYSFSKSDLDQAEKLGDDPNYKYDIEDHLTKFAVNGNLFEGMWNQKLYVSLLRRISHSIDESDEIRTFTSSRSFNNASRIKAGWENYFTFAAGNTITFGVEYKKEIAETSYRSESEWGPYESIFPENDASITSVFLQDQFNSVPNLFLTAGLRYDNHNKFGKRFTFRLAPAYYISSTQTKLKGTYGTGFKSPSLFNLYDPMFGNTELKPENSKGWDVGFEQWFFNERAAIEIIYFQIDFDNMIGFDENFKSVNINKAQTSGLEFSSSFRFKSNLNIKLNYTFIKAFDKSPGISKDKEKLIRRPEHKGSLIITYDPLDKLSLNTVIRYTGSREDEDFSGYPSQRVTLKEYVILDFALSYQVLEYLKLQSRVENILDTYYEDVLYYGSMGRSFYVGLGIEL